MKTTKIYKNYGCLAAEKRIIYTHRMPQSTAVCSDEITIEIPEGWEPYENDAGNMLLMAPWGWGYDINELLGGNENPYFIAIDKNGKEKRIQLKIINE